VISWLWEKNKNANACPFGFMETVKNGFWPPLSHRKSTTILILFLTLIIMLL
jgi:hypothetical protein